MILVTWNVNSIRARQERLLSWLDEHRPDVLCLQELKVDDDQFPFAEVEARGYHAVVYGQRTYNGVGILSRREPTDVHKGWPKGDDDDQARLISATIDGAHIISAYFPNGGETGSDKYEYKLDWMKRLGAYLKERFSPTERVALCGDFNVAPYADDVSHKSELEGSVLANDTVRAALQEVQGFGLIDTFRPFHPKGGVFSWWDYRAGSFEADAGLRIDHIYCTPPLAEKVIGAMVDTEERRGKGASDHAPVMIELA